MYINRIRHYICSTIKPNWPDKLTNAQAIGDYIAEHSTEEIDTEFVEEYFRGSKASLQELAITKLKEGPSANNIPNRQKQTKYNKMDLSTMPPLVVEDIEGNGIYTILDGNHRFRAAKSKNAKTIWAYVVTGQ